MLMSQEAFSLNQTALNVLKKTAFAGSSDRWLYPGDGREYLLNLFLNSYSFSVFHPSRLSKLNGGLFNMTVYVGPIYM